MKFELDVVKTDTSILVKNYDELIVSLEEHLAKIPVYVITNNTQKSEMKNSRADLNKIAKMIDRYRIDSIEDLCGNFISQCKKLSEIVKQKSIEIDSKIKDYEASLTNEIKEKETQIIVKISKDKIDLFKEFCDKNDIKYTLKGE